MFPIIIITSANITIHYHVKRQTKVKRKFEFL